MHGHIRPVFELREGMMVGFPELDEQHRSIVAAIRELFERQQQGMELKTALDALVARVQEHTRTEEGFLLKNHVAGFKDHHMRHTTFLAGLVDLRDRAEQEGFVMAPDVAELLMEYFVAHILTVDGSYSNLAQRRALTR